MVRDTEYGSDQFLHIKDDVTQGGPLVMITYGIGVLPIIRELRDAQPRVTQPRYADDVGAGDKFGHIMEHFRDLQTKGPPWG